MEKSLVEIKIAEFDALITEARHTYAKSSEAEKSMNKLRLDTIASIKDALLRFKTAQNAKPLTEEEYNKMLKTMVKMRKDAETAYILNKGNAKDPERKQKMAEMAEKEKNERLVIEEFLPKSASVEDMEAEINKWIAAHGSLEPGKMGQCIGAVRKAFSNVDGAQLAQLVKSKLG